MIEHGSINTMRDTAQTLTQIGANIGKRAGLLVDWDGCLAITNRLQPEAIRFLRAHQDRVAIVSNNSTELPEDFSRTLACKGLAIPPRRVILAGAETLEIAAQQRAQRVLVLGNHKMMSYARRLGLSLVRSDPELVVLLRDTRMSYLRLERAANALKGGAHLLVANPDKTHPGDRGLVVPETGALLAALLTCVDASSITTKVVGKPGPHLFWRACESLGVEPEDALMIGDNPDTDIAGARSLGMEAVLVDTRGDDTASPSCEPVALSNPLLSTA